MSAVQMFLNDAASDSDGWIKASVKIKKNRHKDDAPWLDGRFVVSDCSHKAEIELDVWDTDPEKMKVAVKKRRKKIARLKKSIVKFCDDYEKALDTLEVDMAAHQKRAKKKAKEKKQDD